MYNVVKDKFKKCKISIEIKFGAIKRQILLKSTLSKIRITNLE